MTTNRYGDMLLELRDPNTPQGRVDEITRTFNELSDREEVYASWLQYGSKIPKFERVAIRNVRWLDSPNHPISCSKLTTASIANDTDVNITFTQVISNSNVFSCVEGTDQVRIRWSGHFVLFTGLVDWAANGSGYRVARIDAYDSKDVVLGSGVMHNFAGFTGADNWFPFTFVFAPNSFPTMEYIKCVVYQNSGASLTLNSFFLGLSIV